MFDFYTWHQMASSAFHVMAFDCNDISAAKDRPGSLTHWNMWYPSLFSSLKMIPFLRQNTDFSAQNDPFFEIKYQLFSRKWTSFFVVKYWLFSPNEPPFQCKTLHIRINPFFSKFTEVSTKIPSFSSKMWILDFLKKYTFIREF